MPSGWKWVLKHIVLAIAFSALLAACDPGPRFESIGVSRDSSGILIYFTPCEDERITRAQLIEIQGEEVLVADEDDVVRWEIQSSRGVGLSVLRVGVTPRGFKETVRFSGRDLTGKSFTARIEYKDHLRVWVHDFRISDLKSDSILTEMGARDLQTFRKEGEDLCRTLER